MEFKRLSDVEVVAEPTESANVLIEENGVIKKAPKTAVGGAGGETPDMVIRTSCRPDYGSTVTALNPANISIIEGGLSNVMVAISENRVPVVLVETFHNDGDSGMLFSRTYASVSAYGGVYRCIYVYCGNSPSYIHISFSDDGTVNDVSNYPL